MSWDLPFEVAEDFIKRNLYWRLFANSFFLQIIFSGSWDSEQKLWRECISANCGAWDFTRHGQNCEEEGKQHLIYMVSLIC